VSEQYEERRRDGAQLRYAVDTLNGTVGDLKIAVGELKITIGNMRERDGEDRAGATKVAEDVNDLKLWRARIKGQLALIWLLVGLVGGATIGHLLKLTP
jgi:hypothetical protein